jgi:exopolysaccharide biosynthesis polyprenyl glycosylphosphotransferase
MSGFALRPLGQFASVFLAVGGIQILVGGGSDGVGEPFVLSGIWLLSLRMALKATSARTPMLGIAIPAAVGAVIGAAVISVVGHALPRLDIVQAHLWMTAAAVLVVFTLYAHSASRLCEPRRLLVVGSEQSCEDLTHELQLRSGTAFACLGFVADDISSCRRPERYLGSTRILSDIASRERPDVIVLAEETDQPRALDALLEEPCPKCRVLSLHQFHEHAFGRVPVSQLRSTWFMSLVHLYQRPYPQLTKRLLDLVVAASALVLLVPLLPILALLVRLSGPGPILFRQPRLGAGGRAFDILKFRTMIDGAEKGGLAVWAAEHDARITPVGRLLRRTRLDEVPQLWNVLRGDMSIVGPRPERPEFFDVLRSELPYWSRRHLVKPGITGWAQVKHGYASDASATADKLAYDLYYLKHRSLLFDLTIMARTLGVVVSGFGSR